MDVFISERAIASKFQIEAKECKIERESDSGVCMFNYECYKRKGTVLGTCIDGFLFGACCRLPKEGEDEELVDITEEDDEVSTKKPDSSDETVSILSDLLSKSDLESIDEIINEIENDDEDEEEVITASTEASQEMIENSLFLDSIEVPLEIDNNIPSIILGNGSVVSLESLSLKPELYKPTTEGSSTSQQQENNNQLFTWFTIDQLFNSTTTESTTSSESTSTTLMTGSTQDLPFLDDLFSFDDEFLSSTTKSKTSTTTSTTSSSTTSSTTTSSTTTSTTTTTTTSTTITSTTPTSTTTSSTSTSTTTTTTTTAKTSTVKSTTDSIWPDPFLDLGNKEKVTLR